jgi:hypothetical protein
MPLHMNKPKPVPFSDFVVNFVNSLGNMPASIPLPVSFMLIMTCCVLLLNSSSFFSKMIAIVPPLSSVNNVFVAVEAILASVEIVVVADLYVQGSHVVH